VDPLTGFGKLVLSLPSSKLLSPPVSGCPCSPGHARHEAGRLLHTYVIWRTKPALQSVLTALMRSGKVYIYLGFYVAEGTCDDGFMEGAELASRGHEQNEARCIMTCAIASICARATRTYTTFVWNAGAARAAYYSFCSLKFAAARSRST